MIRTFTHYDNAVEFLEGNLHILPLSEDLKEAGIRRVNNRWQVWIYTEQKGNEDE